MNGPRTELCQFLCSVEDIPGGGSRAFVVRVSDVAEEIFLVRKGLDIVAYSNSCPHTKGPLDWVPGQFLNLEGDLIQCATHDALFRIEDGLCIRGPCSGQSLSPVPIRIADNAVWLVQKS
ncbi:MAG: Rieske (2Fe-2S) protein [Thiogranum sp.]|nr:Rieske (2Fe-2S) protein [Thiogranum sp.]